MSSSGPGTNKPKAPGGEKKIFGVPESTVKVQSICKHLFSYVYESKGALICSGPPISTCPVAISYEFLLRKHSKACILSFLPVRIGQRQRFPLRAAPLLMASLWLPSHIKSTSLAFLPDLDCLNAWHLLLYPTASLSANCNGAV